MQWIPSQPMICNNDDMEQSVSQQTLLIQPLAIQTVSASILPENVSTMLQAQSMDVNSQVIQPNTKPDKKKF